MRDRARAVVVGGGVGGCAILYWLARLGWSDVLLVERADLTSGSTFHSAGLVGQLRGSLSLTKMMMSSVDLYRELGEEVGLETGWREVGSLRLASSQERIEELARQAGWAKTFGLPLELVLAEGARRRGAEIATRTRVTGIRVERNRVTAVETDQGDVETELVVNAGGMFAGEIGALAGVVVPIVPMANEYLITRPSSIPLDVPTMRDPSLLVYFRGESGGLVMGGYERHPAPWGLDGIPPDFNGRLLEEDWPRFVELMENALVRVPSLGDMEIVRLINGPEAFTPDGEFILGPTDERVEELGAAWGEKSGWERANWFESNAARGDESLRPRGWAGRLWSPAIGAEHVACREAAALFDAAWIRSNAPDDGSVSVEDVTSKYACLGLWGPRAREILQPLTTTPLDFPYMRARELAVGPVPCTALRVTYVGELGWELYCPMEFALRLWDELWTAGRGHGLVAGGYRAIDSLRLEKGYRLWGADVPPGETPYEAGLDFVGREALLAASEPERRLCCLVLADPLAVALGSEPVRVGGEIVGRVTSGGYGYTIERSIAYAYLPAAAAEVGTALEVEIFGDWVGGEVAA